jgi:hypothetical protein
MAGPVSLSQLEPPVAHQSGQHSGALSSYPLTRTTVSIQSARFCLLPRTWTASRVRGKVCDARHHHINLRRAKSMVENFEAIWLDGPNGILRRTRRGSVPNCPSRGKTAKFGEVLSAAFCKREGWAVAMVRTIRMQQEREGRYGGRSNIHRGAGPG